MLGVCRDTGDIHHHGDLLPAVLASCKASGVGVEPDEEAIGKGLNRCFVNRVELRRVRCCLVFLAACG